MTGGPSERESFVEVQGNEVPHGGAVFWYGGVGGARLRGAHWLNPEGALRGTVFVLPGKGEYIEKYFEVIGELLARDFAVVSLDWRGQGLSHRDTRHALKAHIIKFETFLDDFEMLYAAVADKCPGPHFGLAHSMGGNIALRLAAERAIEFEALILSAPMTGLKMGRAWSHVAEGYAAMKIAFGRAEEFIRGAELNDPFKDDFDNNRVTKDLRRYKRSQSILHACPELAQAGITYGWMNEALKTSDLLFKHDYDERLRVPVLLCLAMGDQLVNIPSTERLATMLPNCTLIEFDGADHEILMEEDAVRAKFWAAFDEFIKTARA